MDGHISCFGLRYIKYINKPETKQLGALGCPYITHEWQVGDLDEQNSCFKIATYDYQRVLINFKIQRNLPPILYRSDVIPVVNYTWNTLFARQDYNLKAILKRGWNPLDMCLLKALAVTKTKVAVLEDHVQVTINRTEVITVLHSFSATTAANPSTASSNDPTIEPIQEPANLNNLQGFANDILCDIYKHSQKQFETETKLQKQKEQGQSLTTIVADGLKLQVELFLEPIRL